MATFSQNISKGKVHGEMIKFCEYKLQKMLPKSKILDAEACLSCSCNKKRLACKDITDILGCQPLAGGLYTQNPFSREWPLLIDPLINSIYLGKYRVLQVRTQVVAGINTYFKLLVVDRLCSLQIFTSLQKWSEITGDPCILRKNPVEQGLPGDLGLLNQ